MKRLLSICATALMLCMTTIPAFAAEPELTAQSCYPTAVTRTEDGSEIRKMYDLDPTDDPAGIPRSDFEQDGFHYTMVELLKQELPENESRQHIETVSVASKSKDMASILALLPENREFITEDGLAGILTLKLDSVKVDVAGYGSSTKELVVSRTYPGLGSQDTSSIPKTVADNDTELTLQSIDWQTDSNNHFTAVATYAGSTTSSYVKGYTVTADYTGTVSRIALNKTRYVAIFEGKPIAPEPFLSPDNQQNTATIQFNWTAIMVPIGIVALAGVGIGVGIFIKRRNEADDGGDEA